MTKFDDIIEEIEEHKGTGVELETLDDGDDDIEEPWDPRLIRVDPKTFSVRNILDMIDEDDLELAPDFQRGKVWNHRQKARLIESILLRIPLPAFYFSEDNDGLLQVIDGLQRLSTIHDFVRGEPENRFKLEKLEYLQDEVGGKDFKDIEGTLWARRIYKTQINANIVDPQTPDKLKFDIFKRINTGGSPLNAQEIRHCMSAKRSRAFLKRLASMKSFRKATNHKLDKHVRMVDREVILRFCAFRLLENIEDYGSTGALDAFLTETTRKIDHKLSKTSLDKLKEDFDRAMQNAYRLFGEHAFRKWPEGSDRLPPINRALFESWGVTLADYDWNQIKNRKKEIVKAARAAMRSDEELISSITSSTSSIKKVTMRFSKIKKLFEEVGF